MYADSSMADDDCQTEGRMERWQREKKVRAFKSNLFTRFDKSYTCYVHCRSRANRRGSWFWLVLESEVRRWLLIMSESAWLNALPNRETYLNVSVLKVQQMDSWVHHHISTLCPPSHSHSCISISHSSITSRKIVRHLEGIQCSPAV